MATKLQAVRSRNFGSIRFRGTGFLSSQRCPDRVLSPAAKLEAGHPSPSIGDLKMYGTIPLQPHLCS